MKQEWWKKKLREDAELHFPDHEKNGNEPYRQPDSAQFLPRKIQPRTIAQYGAATAAALVLLAGAGVLIHRSGLRETGIPLESGGISYAASAAVGGGNDSRHDDSNNRCPNHRPKPGDHDRRFDGPYDSHRAVFGAGVHDGFHPRGTVRLCPNGGRRLCAGRVHRRIRRQADTGQRRALRFRGAI